MKKTLSLNHPRVELLVFFPKGINMLRQFKDALAAKEAAQLLQENSKAASLAYRLTHH
jgi:hypothetical protein